MPGPGPDPGRGVYGISVAAELTGLGVQNLRLYESRGLVEPDRTDGGTRRYSEHDLERLRRITELLGAGLNLAGVGMVLGLQDEVVGLQGEVLGLQGEVLGLQGEVLGLQGENDDLRRAQGKPRRRTPRGPATPRRRAQD